MDAVLKYQLEENPLYVRFYETLSRLIPEKPGAGDVPLLPIGLFREAEVIVRNRTAALTFRSSGTTSMELERSRHLVADPELYRNACLKGFGHFFPGNPVVWGYLPGYADNPDSSLIRMVQHLIEQDTSGLSRMLVPGEPLPDSGLKDIKESGRPLVLFGAAFGLLDLLEWQRSVALPEESHILETGGMKTHRREIPREELHQRLGSGFNVPPERVHSEYGMCEMLSQAYSLNAPWLEPVPWLQITIRNAKAPLKECTFGEEGLIGIIDLANLYSCPFILTGDRGVADKNGRFQVLGRYESDNLRGCNFLVDRD